MRNISESDDVLKRLKKLLPAGITPKFTTANELMAWHRVEGEKRSVEIEKLNKRLKSEQILGRSGIQNLHQGCTFENYYTSTEGQRDALNMAKNYAENFGKGFSSFVFSGNAGTGKNHLAAAIGNALLRKNITVLVVTIPDLMMRVRECYSTSNSESELINGLCEVDLLVLDEVGIQHESKNEKIVLNQIIDRRLSNLKPVGVLTNLNSTALERVLGARVMDRLTMDNGIWINFTWGSYRKKVTHLKLVK